MRTIVEEIEKQLTEKAETKPRSIEGLNDSSWVLMDYGDFVVHVFLDEVRRYYDLERLWSDVPKIPFSAGGPSSVSATTAAGGE